MRRARPIQQGHVFKKGPSWFLQWREDVRTPDGNVTRQKFTRRLAPARLAGKQITQREAERLAWEQVLSKLNQVAIYPQSLATIAEYWQGKFEPEHIAQLKPAGQKHYKWCATHILPAIGTQTMRETSRDTLRTFCLDKSRAGLGSQSITHLRNALSALFRHAIEARHITGDNPARGFRVPQVTHRPARALSFADAQRLMNAYPAPVKQMVHTSLLTSLNIAELAALRVKHLNLTDAPAQLDAEVIPPYSLIVRENYYEGQYSTVKTAARRRTVPLVPALVVSLLALIATNPAQGSEAHVFQNRRGGAINYHNLARRTLKPIADRLGIAGVSWHVFRRSTATWAELIDMPLSERIAVMGHASGTMTMHYTQPDIERRRQYLDEMQHKLIQ